MTPSHPLFDTLHTAHPRLILLPGGEERIHGLILTDPMAQRYYAHLVMDGEQILKKPLSERVLVGREPTYMYMLQTSREVLDRIYTLGLLYRLTCERRWAVRAIAELLNAARFVDWNPAHWLDTAEMMHAQAIGYDWLYDAMTQAQRDELVQAMLVHGFDESEKAYQTGAWWAKNSFNWNTVCNSGIIAGALGFAEHAPARAEALVEQALDNMPYALASFAPDGAWAEGPAYWGYAMRYTQTAFACLTSALGGDFSLGKLPGLAEAGWFRMQGVGPTGLYFNFADASLDATFEPALFWLGRRYHTPAFTQAALDSDRPIELDAPFGAAARALIFYDPIPTPVEKATLDAHYQKAHLAFFRSAWNDANAFYVGFKGGDNQANHSHLDLGTFVMDGLGERWAIDLGRDDYTLPGYWETRGRRWGYFRLATAGHNTLVLDGLNQDPTAEAPIIDFGSQPERAYAVADLTAGYAPAGAVRVLRGIELGENRRSLLVTDQVETDHPVKVTWQMFTQAAVELHGRSALLSQNGKSMRLELLAPADGVFTTVEIQLDPPQLPLENTRCIQVKLGLVMETEIQVRLRPEK